MNVDSNITLILVEMQIKRIKILYVTFFPSGTQQFISKAGNCQLIK